MRFTDEDKEMVARLIKGFEHDLEELNHDQYGHAEIVSDLKESCREKIGWLEAFQVRMEQEPNDEPVNSRLLDEDTYKALRRLGILDTSVRSYNRGTSDYSQHIIQPWAIWQEYQLNPFDADIVKRILRTKEGDSRRLDYEKIIHICEERIRQIDAED
jgi:hypothetical protein